MKREKYCLPLDRNTNGFGNLSRSDLAEQSWIDGRLAVLACHNDEGTVVESL